LAQTSAPLLDKATQREENTKREERFRDIPHAAGKLKLYKVMNRWAAVKTLMDNVC
jgi:hypothetical protein